jgi:uncharacterized protein (TIGR00725 family)
MPRIIIGVMGGGSVSSNVERDAFRLGELIAERGWVLLNGGRDAGVMAASAAGAHSKGGLVIGVLPGKDRGGMSPDVDLPIVTGMGSARNNINVLSSDVVIACAGGAGTISEVALALKANRSVVALNLKPLQNIFPPNEQIRFVSTPDAAIAAAEKLLAHRKDAKSAEES